MATGRRGLHKGRLPPSPQCIEARLSSLSRYSRSPNISKRNTQRIRNHSNGSRFSDGDELDSEGFDEIDRCLTHDVENDLYDSQALLEDVSCTSSNELLLPDRSHCDDQRLSHRSGQTDEGRRSRIYPNLKKEFEEEMGEPLRGRHHNGPTPAILIGMVLLMIISIIITGHFVMRFAGTPSLAKDRSKSLQKIYDEMAMEIKILRSETEQSRQFWVQVLTQIKSLKEESPPRPAIILGLVPRDSQSAAVCLSQRLVNLVSDAFGDAKSIAFDTQSSQLVDGDALKYELDQTLKGLNSSHAAAIYNLEKLMPDAAMIFHAYCDTDNAPFKRALIIFTLGIDLHFSSQLIENIDWTATKHLMSLWETSLREEDAAAVVSRIANSPVVFSPERREVIQRLCPY